MLAIRMQCRDLAKPKVPVNVVECAECHNECWSIVEHDAEIAFNRNRYQCTRCYRAHAYGAEMTHAAIQAGLLNDH